MWTSEILRAVHPDAIQDGQEELPDPGSGWWTHPDVPVNTEEVAVFLAGSTFEDDLSHRTAAFTR